MKKIKIHVSNVSKSYRKFQNEFHRFLSWFGLKSSSIEHTDVLNNINFSVAEGEAVGLVGENGAGKSTLLKIITGTVQPSLGNIAVNGRISAILELGLGFNPEMTGKQNVYLSAGVMGFRQNEIDGLIDGILAFSELGSYFHEPVRTYSSGMQMRLAFSIATAVRPTVLIIDEALSVGDTYFQHKSFNRIKEFREQGTTLLFVSHDRSAIQTLCNRAILLEKGTIIKDGKPEEVMDFYNALISEKENSTVVVKTLESGDIQTTSGTEEAIIDSVSLHNKTGDTVEYIGVGDSVKLILSVKINDNIDNLVMGMAIKNRLGQVIYGTNTWHTEQSLTNLTQGSYVNYTVNFDAELGTGSYSVAIALHDSETHLTKNYEWRDLALVFNVVNVDKPVFEGCSWLNPQIDITVKK